MSPDVAAAVDELGKAGILSADAAALVGPVARGERVSVRAELRALFYGGVLLAMAGVGALARENLDRLGPVAVASGIGLAAFLCLGWVVRVGPPFSRGQVASPNLAFDYILLLGVLLSAAELAYLETQFTPLGGSWPLHFLLVAALAFALAFRYDSRALFSLGLASVAAWRGVSVSLGAARMAFPGGAPEGLRWNALGCGIVFAFTGMALGRSDLKPHFEGVATHLGALLVLGALLSGCGVDTADELTYTLALLLVAGGLALVAARARRFSLFGLGILACYLAFGLLVARARPQAATALFLLALSALGLVAGLIRARRLFRGDE
jgi:hypothetical protein